MEKKIKEIKEIPFGAKDSELYKFEYTIPEGYEARIEDGMVIVKKKESEDEKIRKELIDHCIQGSKQRTIVSHKEDYIRWIVWLEKQKEQKPAEMRDSRQIALMIENGRRSGVIEGRKQVVGNPEEYGLCKLLEWREEDEQWLESIIKDYEDSLTKDKDHAAVIKIKIDFLKSLRPQPHWKPSMEQMEALMLAIEGKCPPTSYMSRRLEDLYEVLANEYNVECKLENSDE